MRNRKPVTVFWTAVLVAIAALGIAYPTLKTHHPHPAAVIVAGAAVLVGVVAFLAASRILIALTRSSRIATRHR